MTGPKHLYDEQTEAALIGAALLDPTLFTIMDPTDFGAPGFSKLWSACQDLVRKGVTPDAATLPIDALPARTTTLSFMNACPSALRADGYARIVKAFSRRRKLLEAASCFARAAQEDQPGERDKLLTQAHDLLREAAASPVQLHSLASLLVDQTPKPRDIVQGFIPGRSVLLFSGPGGDGKSYAMLDLSVCASHGPCWLSLDVHPTPVLIIDLENDRSEVQGRVRKVMRGHSLVDAPPVTFAFDLISRLDSDDVVWEVVSLAEQCNAGLVILDSLVDFCGEIDENSNTDMARVAARLRAIAHRAGTSLLAVHHVPKHSPRTPRGATALRNGVDVSVIVSRGDNTLTMRQDKNRRGPEMALKARLNWGDGSFNLSPVEASTDKSERPQENDEAAILEVVDDSDTKWVTSNEIVKKAMESTGGARSTLHYRLRGLVDRGVLEEKSQGPGKPYLVRRPEKPDQEPTQYGRTSL